MFKKHISLLFIIVLLILLFLTLGCREDITHEDIDIIGDEREVEPTGRMVLSNIETASISSPVQVGEIIWQINSAEDRGEGIIYDEIIFSLHGQKLTTGNLMGFVGINGSELTIQSRFAIDKHDYFLHYLLQKVFSFNLFELKHRSNKENIFDFLIYLFPFFLKKALGQGLFKEYQKKSYNDANVRGNIDINSHIRNNIPFNGKIAYRVREHSYDNKITQLVRHTIEFIKRHRFANGVLTSSNDIQSCVLQIVQATPTYDYNSRKSVINLNLRPLVHPYFSEYKDLQKICLQILRYEGLKFGEKDDKIYGLLFDGAWLWEEYLNTVLKDCNFIHPMNKASKYGSETGPLLPIISINI